MKKTQKEKILNFLSSGGTLNENQAEKMFGVKNLTARISDLRSDGHCIYLKKSEDLSKAASYRLGSPNQEMVKLAYTFGGASVFS